MGGEDAFYKEVGRRIREARRRRKPALTQDGLARLVGLTRTSITNIEQGRQKCLIYTLSEIATALQVEPASLLPIATFQFGGLNQALKHRAPKEKEWIISAVTAATLERNDHGA